MQEILELRYYLVQGVVLEPVSINRNPMKKNQFEYEYVFYKEYS
ncbi:hypothetical protein SAMN05421863_102212 [Nitrosomonas communis]|uniref:Uncharacterized protein n=1 Tax=Nitrosomonas communis TaxID=44574 RepID=A0A1I4PQ62_9PROT|nr:hypothetical protein SAMN05421863_102212 [Nitrosomonas communis]